MSIVDKILRIGEGRQLRRLEAIAKKVDAIEEKFVAMTDEELKGQTQLFKDRLANGETLDDLLVEAFATVREASRRTLGMRHFPVQIMGGAALHWGNIAEMKTGEGKTLVATLPSYLRALTGKGVHVVTVNDYLASYQSELMGRVYRFLGMTTGCILNSMTPKERREEYNCDITYGTNNEFGFDYLRDNMAELPEEMVQRGHNYVIVDEVDSILIDEARTPLIISGPSTEDVNKWYAEFATIANKLTVEQDYEVDEKKKTVGILESGIEKVEDYLGIDNLYEAENTPLIGFLNNAIKAKEIFKRDIDYIVSKDNEILIVDEHTGRVLPGRRYSEGMHQAIEAKEKVKINSENQTLATITLQNYFRLYPEGSRAGMTGTAETEAAEFASTYKIGVIPIPSNRPMIRKDNDDVVYVTEIRKLRAIVQDIVERHEKGQPVLVGTTSVEKSELLSSLLKEVRVPHEVLNAKQHEREAGVIAMAGRKGAVTVATNMAGRGTDIMLGGNAEFIAIANMKAKGYDVNVDPESYEKAWPEVLQEAKEAVSAEHDEVVKLGGLYVLGTERHESRRIDNQLRGRSGRQGDPGESRFYLSMEDDLMRLFNNSLAQRIMNSSGFDQDTPLEYKIVTRGIASAQRQVESRNFEIRKNVLKYDDIMTEQREKVYSQRRRVLEGEDLREQIVFFAQSLISNVVNLYCSAPSKSDWDLTSLWSTLREFYPVSITIEDFVEETGSVELITQAMLIEELTEDIKVAYEKAEQDLSENAVAISQLGEDPMRQLERRVLLATVDRMWREHLYEMDYLKEGIGLRAMAQRDPLVEYANEGAQMFATMMERIREETVTHIFGYYGHFTRVYNELVESGAIEKVEEQSESVMGDVGQAKTTDNLQYHAPDESGQATSSDDSKPKEQGNRQERRAAKKKKKK
ncbi:preprotein translocase subunit SecA [Actinomyces sp. zg-332]|uniref:preprotein translocase subunit SecA n=1 Tax=Actinomyces sp. zg-332 TaxID=2708340 RepID=UPI00142373EF|nr:preprotein translocase subunit SecA [Actinomyces sp. zg-332]QPK94634.1 preprotein translocase subunit SecA [Actinomyces sp. zg-332]